MPDGREGAKPGDPIPLLLGATCCWYEFRVTDELHDVLASHQEDPATKAARRIDWDSFMARLSERNQSF